MRETRLRGTFSHCPLLRVSVASRTLANMHFIHPMTLLSTLQRVQLADEIVPPPPRQHLESTQDLLARFHLHSAYDRYVRPSVLPGNEAGSSGAGAGLGMASGDKGKGKEVDMDGGDGAANVGSEALPGGGEGEEDDGAAGKGEKKMKNSYKHLIKGLPGACFPRSFAAFGVRMAVGVAGVGPCGASDQCVPICGNTHHLVIGADSSLFRRLLTLE